MSVEIPDAKATVEYMELEPAIAGLIHDLPWMGSNWTRKERDAWLKAFNAVCDMLYPDDDPAKHEIDAASVKYHVANDAAAEKMREKDEPAPAVAAPAKRKPDPEPEPTPVVAPRLQEIPTLSDATPEHFEPQPYRGAKGAARIVLDLIKRVGKTAHVWVNKAGRVKVAGEDYKPTSDDKLVGVYTPDVKKSAIAADLKAAGPE